MIESLFGMYNAHSIYNIWYKRLNTFAKNFLFSKRKSTYSNRAETLRMCVPCVYYNTTTRTRIHRLRKMFTRKNGVEINILFSENNTWKRMRFLGRSILLCWWLTFNSKPFMLLLEKLFRVKMVVGWIGLYL